METIIEKEDDLRACDVCKSTKDVIEIWGLGEFLCAKCLSEFKAWRARQKLIQFRAWREKQKDA